MLTGTRTQFNPATVMQGSTSNISKQHVLKEALMSSDQNRFPPLPQSTSPQTYITPACLYIQNEELIRAEVRNSL